MLRRARDRAGLAQSAVAAAVGVQRAFINKLEHSDRCPSLLVATALTRRIEPPRAAVKSVEAGHRRLYAARTWCGGGGRDLPV
ncbi:helix-turn-helix transcriptional regulator [Streptomyces mirabilis]|uniref:helix-turn-helix transcriptional regulator n=1 Tax=Streptomyces mirabilis TaxID=68239 RepID=UPI00332639BD